MVRRMFHALGLPLRQLHREAIGPLSCAKLALAPGEVTSVPASQAKRVATMMTPKTRGKTLEIFLTVGNIRKMSQLQHTSYLNYNVEVRAENKICIVVSI